jgi:hypothetical protein
MNCWMAISPHSPRVSWLRAYRSTLYGDLSRASVLAVSRPALRLSVTDGEVAPGSLGWQDMRWSTTISQQQAGPQTLVALKGYFDANPQAGKDLQAIQQPLTSPAPAATTSAVAVPAGNGPLPGPAPYSAR